MTRRMGWIRCAVAGTLVLLVFVGSPAGAVDRRPQADVRVKGLGLLRDHSLRRTLLLLLGNERGATLKAGAIEDAVLLIYANLAEEGYLKPDIRVTVEPAEGSASTYPLDPTLDHPLPRSIDAVRATFRVREGKRYAIADIVFSGLTAIPAKKAESYFRGEGLLAALAGEKSYSPERMRRSAGNLLGSLRRLGYAEAQVTASDVATDPATGHVRIQVQVRQGPIWRVRALALHVADGTAGPVDIAAKRMGLAWSAAWQHDTETDLRRWYYHGGHPDVRLSVVPQAAPEMDGERAVTAVATVRPGPLVRLGSIRFTGNTRTRESILRPLVRAKPGALLDPLQIQDGQFRLSRLGVFSAVDLKYVPADGAVRDAVYALQEGKKQDVDLLLGWGSFEELRGGVQWRDYDLFNRANEGSLKFVQSMKSTEGEYDYTVPELFGRDMDGTAKLFGFDGRERAYYDEEYGATLSVEHHSQTLGADMLAGYTFVKLGTANNTLATELTDLNHASATSVQLGLTRDRRDNPLAPRHGYKLFLSLQEASRWLGGQVDFQEFQIGGSYHTSWGQTRWIHVGFTHAVITTFGAPANNQLPPNILFFPGGEDSIRGYGQGEAAPRNALGQYLGARTYTLLNLELEQALTSKLSAVLFNDDLGASDTLATYPFGYRLYSVGAGLRYRTLVGPVRIEYGRNLNPRPKDPSGTVQFSVGFPF